jgi:hypothetical protein
MKKQILFILFLAVSALCPLFAQAQFNVSTTSVANMIATGQYGGPVVWGQYYPHGNASDTGDFNGCRSGDCCSQKGFYCYFTDAGQSEILGNTGSLSWHLYVCNPEWKKWSFFFRPFSEIDNGSTHGCKEGCPATTALYACLNEASVEQQILSNTRGQ